MLDERDDVGHDRYASRRQLGDGRDVEVTEDRHGDRPRNRRGGEHQHMRRGRSFAAQSFALLDAEAVLLVDDDKSEVEELDAIAHQRVGSDYDLRAAGNRRQGGPPPVGDRHLAGDHGRSERRGEIRPECLHNRPQVLSGKHLGRGQQGGLPSGVGDSEHPPQSHQRLPGPDLALQQAVHRGGGCQIGCDLLPHLLLVAGEGERQLRVEALQEPAGLRHTRRRRLGAQQGTLLQQRPLQHERLLETQCLTCGPPLDVLLRAVDEFDRARIGHQFAVLADRIRNRVWQRRQRVQHNADRLLQLPGGDGCRRRVDRNRPFRPFERGIGRGIRLEQLVVGVGQLTSAAVLPDLARKDSAHARLQLVFAPSLIEERQTQGALAIRDARLEDGAALGLHRTLADLDHLGHDGDVLVVRQLTEHGQLAAQRVPARVMAEQVTHRLEAQVLLHGRRGATAERGTQFYVERGIHVSTVPATAPHDSLGHPK